MKKIRKPHIRNCVSRLVDELGLQPPVDVEGVASHKGIPIEYTSAEDELSGFIVRSGETTLIGVNAGHPKTRQRFTIAHEIGHFILHDNGQEVHVDKGFSIRLRKGKSADSVEVEEREANFFAAELLMPERFLQEDVEKHEKVDLENGLGIDTLAEKYGVSTQAMTIRLNYLSYVHID